MKDEQITPIIKRVLGLDLFRKMYLSRRSEEYIIKYYPEDEMKTPMHMSLGQEAVSVAVCHAIGSSGLVLNSYRSHSTFLAHTENIDLFFAELYGRTNGLADGKSGSMHLADPERGHWGSVGIVAGSIPIAVGLAFSQKHLETDSITAVFFGDGAVDEGSFWESINIACVMKLPIIFVCEDNGYAVHTNNATRHGYHSISEVIAKFDCSVFYDESNDVESIYQVAKQAQQIVSSGKGPAFLHIKCYRYLEHVGINDDIQEGYRSLDEYQSWKIKDSLLLQRNKLIQEHKYTADEIYQLEREIDLKIEFSINRARQLPHPKPDQLFRGVFYERD